MRTWRQVRETYDRFRARYFMDADEPLRVPPPAADLRWRWLLDQSLLGATHRDEDGDPDLVEISFGLPLSVAKLVLMHELSHMRCPTAVCSPPDRWWRAETRRLAAADAFSREEIY